MKKILISMFTLIFIISMFTSAVNAATSGGITTVISDDTIKGGDEFTITVSATDSNNLNTVEYSGITITDQSGNVSTAITVKSIEPASDNWSKMTNDDGNPAYVYSNSTEATQSSEVFKITLVADDNISAGTYNINIQGLKVYNAADITASDPTDIGTKSVSVKAVVDTTTVGGDKDTDKEQTPSTTPEDDGDKSGDKSTGTIDSGDSNNDESLPQTGAEVVSVIAIAGLSVFAVISYRLYKKYNNI